VWDEQTSGHTTAGSTGKALLDVSGGSITFDTTSINAIADGILNRDMSVGTDSGSPTFRTPRQALRSLRNKWSIQGGTLTIYKEDDSTTSWTGVISTTADANPVTQTDPAGP
jgi:hypothetical protein